VTPDTPPATLGSISGRVFLGTAPTTGARGAYIHAIAVSAPRAPVRGRMSDVGRVNEAGASVGSGGYVITGLAPGNYYVLLEPINGFTPNPFTFGSISANGPFDSTFPPEWYNGAGESASDNPTLRTVVTVTAGANTANIDFVTQTSQNFDLDSLLDYTDNCPAVTNEGQTDGDGDGHGDACDLCPAIPNPDQLDTDTDADGRADICDNCLNDPNPLQEDFDGDLAGDACDTDDDNDGLLDTVETNTGTFVDANDTGTDPLNIDTDGDTFNDGEEVAAGTDPTNATSFPGSVPALNLPGVLLFALLLLALHRARAWRRNPLGGRIRTSRKLRG